MVLVASPRAIGSTPVASGSRVPACPAFVPVARRVSSTTRLELRPRGLSTTSQPCGPLSSTILVIPGSGVLTVQVALDLRPREQGGNSVGLVKRNVEREDKIRRTAQWNFAGDKPLQEPGAAFESGDDLAGIRAAERHHERRRIAQIRA